MPLVMVLWSVWEGARLHFVCGWNTRVNALSNWRNWSPAFADDNSVSLFDSLLKGIDIPYPISGTKIHPDRFKKGLQKSVTIYGEITIKEMNYYIINTKEDIYLLDLTVQKKLDNHCGRKYARKLTEMEREYCPKLDEASMEALGGFRYVLLFDKFTGQTYALDDEEIDELKRLYLCHAVSLEGMVSPNFKKSI